MTIRQITFQIKGTDEDDGNVQFDDFIKQLTSIKKSLNEVERIVTKQRGSSIYYRVVDLRHFSPAAVVLEATPVEDGEDYSQEVLANFYSGVVAIQEKKQAPPNFDYHTLQALQEMTSLLGTKITEMVISVGYETTQETINVSTDFSKSIERMLGPDQLEVGSVTGMLEQLNLHNEQNAFNVYSAIGGKTKCLFQQNLRQQVIASVGKYVEVYGQLKYKQGQVQPHEVRVNSIEVLSSPDDEELPTLSELRGIAPEILQNKSSEEFVWEIRNEWD